VPLPDFNCINELVEFNCFKGILDLRAMPKDFNDDFRKYFFGTGEYTWLAVSSSKILYFALLLIIAAAILSKCQLSVSSKIIQTKETLSYKE